MWGDHSSPASQPEFINNHKQVNHKEQSYKWEANSQEDR